MSCPVGARGNGGFTLIELVTVIIILGVLAAVAAPMFLNTGQNARRASLNTLAGTLRSTAENVRALCKTDLSCDFENPNQFVTIGGRIAWVNFGWPEAGDNLGIDQIDSWINYGGFTASLPDYFRTKFALDGAPDSSNCSVTYVQATDPAIGFTLTMTTTGC